MRNLHITLGFILVAGCCVTSSWGSECPVDHVCQDFGLEDLGLETGEAAFCQGPGATPICPGLLTNGSAIEVPQTTTTTTTTVTSTASPTTITSTTTTTEPTTTTITTTEPTTTTITTTEPTTMTVTTTEPTTTTVTTTEPTTTIITTTEPTTTSVTASSTSTPVTTLPPSSTLSSTVLTSTTVVSVTFTEPCDPATYTISTTVTFTQSTPVTISPTPSTSTATSTTTTTTALPPSCQQPSATCEGKTPGIYYHQKCECHRYYTCTKSVGNENVLIKNDYRCTGGKIFDPETLACTSDVSVCPYS